MNTSVFYHSSVGVLCCVFLVSFIRPEVFPTLCLFKSFSPNALLHPQCEAGRRYCSPTVTASLFINHSMYRRSPTILFIRCSSPRWRSVKQEAHEGTATCRTSGRAALISLPAQQRRLPPPPPPSCPHLATSCGQFKGTKLPLDTFEPPVYSSASAQSFQTAVRETEIKGCLGDSTEGSKECERCAISPAYNLTPHAVTVRRILSTYITGVRGVTTAGGSCIRGEERLAGVGRASSLAGCRAVETSPNVSLQT